MRFIHRQFAVAALVVAAVSGPRAQPAELAIAGRNNAYSSIASSGRFVAIAWGATTKEGATDVYVASSVEGGRTFRPPTRVTDATTQAHLSGEQPPRISLQGAGQVPAMTVTWTARAAGSTRLLTARSDDGGRSFAQPAVWPGTDAPGNRGWHATATGRDGRAMAVWLDHRELAESGTAGGWACRAPAWPTEGFPRHPQLALSPRGDALVTWDEQTPDGRRVALAEGAIDDKGTAVFTRRTSNGERRGSYPTIAATDEGAVVVWTSGAAGEAVLRVERLSR